MTAAVKTDTSPCGPRSQVDIGTRLRCYSPPFERRPTMRCASPPRRALAVALSLTLGCVALSGATAQQERSEEHTSELQSRLHLVCRLLLEKKKKNTETH